MPTLPAPWTQSVGDEISRQIVDWKLARYESPPPGLLGAAPDPDARRPWMLMVGWLRDVTNRTPRIPGLWDAEHEPDTEDEWKRAFERTARFLFPKAEDLGLALADENAARFEREERSRYVGDMRAANDALSQIDRCNAQRTRITSELGRQVAIYQLLRARVLDDDGE